MNRLFLTGLAGILVLSSCRKDWTCECKSNMSGNDSAETALENMTKKDAESECSKKNISAFGFVVSCELK